MQVSIEWINELVTIKSINLNHLVEKLTLGGFEVEEILTLEIETKNQIALEISATANRSDSLSMQGIATEIATLCKKSLKVSEYSLKILQWKQKTEKAVTTISNQCHCSAFTTVIIENLTNFKVPKWIQQKLLSSNIVFTESLLDFESYILLETGYPLVCYDFSKICSKLKSSRFSLSLSKGKNNETFVAANGLTYSLKDSMMVVRANDSILSIAGMISNQEYQYCNTTHSLLIEGSIFTASKIRQQSRDLGLRTNRSARYEKSLKNKYLVEAIYRFISLLKISNPNLTCKLQTTNKLLEPQIPSICLNYPTVNEILGPIEPKKKQQSLEYLTPETITEYLQRLNFKFVYDPVRLLWNIPIPELRKDDITREIDVIEEIGRLHGFNNFLTLLPNIPKVGKEDSSYQTRKKITSCLIHLGFTEMIHYSLVAERYFVKNEVPLINPLGSEYSYLRSTLIPNLLKTVQENIKQRNLPMPGFEYGHVFSGNILKNLEEKEWIAGIFGDFNTKLKRSKPLSSFTWLEAKGKMEQLFQQLNLSIYWEIPETISETVFHPSKSAELYFLNGKKVGMFGQMSPLFSSEMGIFSEIYCFELELEPIQEQLQTKKLMIYQDYSIYPKIIKDLSFIIQEQISFQTLQKFLAANGTKFLSEITLLDEYVGKSIPANHKSICLQLVFQSKEKTLESKTIEIIVKHLQLLLRNKFAAIMRD